MKINKFKLKKKINDSKILIISIIFFVLLIGYIAIPTLSSFKNITTTETITEWDGTVANSYNSGTGTVDDPYLISTGQELAYLASELESKNTNYEGEYFTLSNNIILNKGIFEYSKENGIKYTKEGVENTIIPFDENDIVNKFKNLDGFKGNFNGNNYTIYGLYIEENLEEQNALFTNLEGNVSNLNVKNSIIYGGKIVAGIASKTNNSKITNILYSGYVISNEGATNEIINIDIEDIIKTTVDNEINDNINISNLNYIPGIVTQIILSGTYQTNNPEGILKINNEVVNTGNFILNLGSDLKSIIPINYQADIESNITLSNLKYQINYDYSNAAGIVSLAENTTLKNVINKSNVIGNVYASGIINTMIGASSLGNSYNKGTIESVNTSTALISNINQNTENVTITNCYDNGNLISNNNSMIGNIENNTGNITLENIFSINDNYIINSVKSTNVYVDNSYKVYNKDIKEGTINGKLTKTTIDTLMNETFIKEDLKYKEYNETENIEDNAWIIRNNELPILYIDDIENSIANIRIEDSIWNNYKNDLNTLKYTKGITFSVEQTDTLNPIKEVYYHVEKNKNPLTKEELDSITNWTNYEGLTEINEEGFYIIYAKIINYSGDVNYINTDLLIIDETSANVTIISEELNTTWNTLKTNLDTIRVDKEIDIKIEAEDSLSGIGKIYYYISDKELSEEEVKEIDTWTEYTKNITLTSEKSIIYAKAVDNYDYTSYSNTDLISICGYILSSISPGMNGNNVDNLYITSNSNVTLNFKYQDTIDYTEDNTHQLVSNILLPQNTKITIIDKSKNKVYKYTTTDSNYGYNNCTNNICEAIYDFTLFNEVGTTKKFEESNFTGKINEDFIINIDFENTTITENLESIYISLRLNSENNKIKTLQSTLKPLNINVENSNAYFDLTTSFNETIKYSENARYTIDFATQLNYKEIEENKIYDTSFENKNIGLSIKMINDKGKIVEKKNLKNISFSIGENKYSPSSDGIVRIDLKNGINNIKDNLVIETYSDNSDLEQGNYKFVISLYAAYDGLYSKANLTSIEIPIYVGKNIYEVNNDFNVIMDNEDKVISTNENEFNFTFLTTNTYNDANIKMSLYKKEDFSPYNQNYLIIDLGDYLVDNLYERYDENIYYASKNINNNDQLVMNLKTNLLEKNGYMIVFELYDGEQFINKINKKFIVK